MHYSLLLAGGEGRRIGGDIPKQFITVDGKMMFTYTLGGLLRSHGTGGVWIVAKKCFRDQIIMDAKDSGLNIERIGGFAEPGRNRQLSIRNGLQEVMHHVEQIGVLTELSGYEMELGTDTILIHDAARPMLSAQLISHCYAALKDHDGVLPVLPMKDTVYYSEDGRRVDQLLRRQCIFAGQAPELFVFRKYFDAVMSLTDEELLQINGSTEIAVKAGMDIVMIPGEERNFKVTTMSDLERFREVVMFGQQEMNEVAE